MKKARMSLGVVAAAIILAGAIAFLLPHPEAPTRATAPMRPEASVVALEPREPAAAPATARRHLSAPRPATKVREEVRDATDLKSLFDRYRELADPSGEISFVLAKMLSECSDFTRTSALVKHATPALAAGGADAHKPAAELARRIARCDGFNALDEQILPSGRASRVLENELYAKALEAGYPGAIARKLGLTPLPGGDGEADRQAVALLSGNVDADVISGIGAYLTHRNHSSSSGSSMWTSSWLLLQCDFGGECGADNPQVYKTCILNGACEMGSVDEVLRRREHPEALRAAYAMRIRLRDAIRNHDWEALGF
ncbi:MAG: hypothetical protein ABI789_09900 [Usitatibacter sp.]